MTRISPSITTITDLYNSRVSDGTLRADPAQHATLTYLDELQHFLKTPKKKPRSFLSRFLSSQPVLVPQKGLYLWGGVGRGKSMLMDLLINGLDIKDKRKVHFHAFMQDIHKQMFEARKTGVDDALTPVADKVIYESRLLAFDEMQITDITDAMIIGRLFQKLIKASVIIVTTSNRPPEDLYKDGLNRPLFLPFIDMLYQHMTVIELQSPNDYRQHRLQEAQVYFTPASDCAAKIEALWRDLTGGAVGDSLSLKVNGRDLILPCFANGVARASFWALCGKPLGPADYLAITNAARALIIEDIPQLSSANYNEAKRFVILIDAVYEAKIRLICSAADVPERLYLEGAGAFEFARTVSRLHEMQAVDWPQAKP